MLNALLPETQVAVHKHPMSNENVILLVGKMDEIICDAEGKDGKYGEDGSTAIL